MVRLNDNINRFPGEYLFTMVGQKREEFEAANPDADVISLGVGDVTQPLAPAIVEAMQKAVLEMGNPKTFRGYGSVQGYEFLRRAIVEGDFKPYGVDLDPDEIFISDGAKSDLGNILELFAQDNQAAVCDPVYPAYVDANVIAGRAGTYLEERGQWSNIMYLPCGEEHGFLPVIPAPDQKAPGIIYLCFPNNPTGIMISRQGLQEWVDYALSTGAVILYDAAYAAFISTPGAPHTIYECDGAKKCAIEIRSYSKTAGFTGTRLGYSVFPKELGNAQGMLKPMWRRRQGTKYNGAPYVIQRGAEAVYTEKGQKQIKAQIACYQRNTELIRSELKKLGYTVYGGQDGPYVWMKIPGHMTSWDFFELLLKKAHVIGTPGEGFGPGGQGFFRLTAFGTYERTKEALERMKAI